MARTYGHGNPKWTRDETILALDLYFRCNGNVPSGDDPRVQQLSEFLRRLPHHDRASRKETFRNPDGVAFKLQNLRQVATGKGLGNVSSMDRNVWAEFGSKPLEVKRLANLIREGVDISGSLESEIHDEDEEFAEGRVLTEVHKTRERSRKIRARLIASRRKQGSLRCDMCDDPSPSTVPEMEDAAFEAHHLIPVAASMERKTRLVDMALLCANCHRLLHRAIAKSKRWLDIGQGRKALGMRELVNSSNLAKSLTHSEKQQP